MAAAALAAWLAFTAPGASAGSAAMHMPVGERPTATVNPPNSTSVAISWPAATGGAPVEGYEVRAYDATTGATRPVGGACAGIVRATACVDAGAPAGPWTYAVVPRQQAWAGEESPRSAAVTVDPDPPTISLTFPTNGAAYTNTTWSAGCISRICGTAGDLVSGVASVAVSVRQGTGSYWNGTAFASPTEVLVPASGTTDWSLSFGAARFPADGTYTVRAVATDATGNTAATSASFTITRVGPTINMAFPTNGGSYSNAGWDAGCSTPAGDVCGSASVPGGTVTSVSVSIRQGTGSYWNGTAFASPTEVLLPATGTTSWTRAFSATSFPADGAYTVRAVATDAAGSTAAASATFTIDRTAPAVPITFPIHGGAYNNTGWNAGCSTATVGDICGTATDPASGVASVSISVRQGSGNYWNGTSFASPTEVLLPATGTTSWTLPFAAPNHPADGIYTVRAVATDRAGNTGSRSVSYVIDRTVPPGATYTFPAPNNTTFTSATWTQGCATPATGDACGTASDALSGVASVSVSLRHGTNNGPYWNGSSFASTSEVFLPATGTTAWNLPFAAANFPADGQYRMRLRVIDRAGNVSSTLTQRTFSIIRFAPSAVTLTNANGTVNPTVDEVNITFNQSPNPSSICSAWSGTGNQSLTAANSGGVVVTITDNGSNDILTVTSTACPLRIGSIQTGRNYVNTTATFSGTATPDDSRVTWTASTRTLNIHLGPLTSGTLSSVAQAAASVSYTPDPAITDIAGNPILSTPFTAANQRF